MAGRVSDLKLCGQRPIRAYKLFRGPDAPDGGVLWSGYTGAQVKIIRRFIYRGYDYRNNYGLIFL